MKTFSDRELNDLFRHRRMSLPVPFDEVASPAAIDRACENLGNEVARWSSGVRNSTGQSPIAICLLKGGAHFFARLSEKTALHGGNLQEEFMLAGTYGDNKAGATTQVALLEKLPALKGRSVLIVDEMCDSGNTFRTLVPLLSEKGATEVKTAALVRRSDSPFIPDFAGMELHDKRWLFGFGMDHQNDKTLRNLPFIAAEKNSVSDHDITRTDCPCVSPLCMESFAARPATIWSGVLFNLIKDLKTRNFAEGREAKERWLENIASMQHRFLKGTGDVLVPRSDAKELEARYDFMAYTAGNIINIEVPSLSGNAPIRALGVLFFGSFAQGKDLGACGDMDVTVVNSAECYVGNRSEKAETLASFQLAVSRELDKSLLNHPWLQKYGHLMGTRPEWPDNVFDFHLFVRPGERLNPDLREIVMRPVVGFIPGQADTISGFVAF